MPGLRAAGAFDDERYLNLETYRGNGIGVRTPVWFATGPKDHSGSGTTKLYVCTDNDPAFDGLCRSRNVRERLRCLARMPLAGPNWIPGQ